MKDRIRIIEKDLDLNNNFFINCVCKQYDTIKFIFHIFMDGEVADLTDCIFRLQAKKGDGLPYVNNKSENISVNGNIVTIDNDNQLTARAGDTVAEVVITDNEGHMKTTFDIRLNIIGSAIDGLVNSEATITILDTLEEKLNRIDNIGTVLDEASIVKNELENNTSIANKASESLNSLIPTGTTLKNTLEPLITNGTTLKTDLDTANTLAEHNIEELNKLGDVTDLAEKVETNTNLIAELNQNDTDIKATIGTETIGTTATTLKGAIKEVKGIADNNTTQLNDIVQEQTTQNNNIALKADKADLDVTNANVAKKADETALEVERARINSFTSLPSGSTTGDAELIDGRVGADGVTYSNVGTAIRTQINKLTYHNVIPWVWENPDIPKKTSNSFVISSTAVGFLYNNIFKTIPVGTYTFQNSDSYYVYDIDTSTVKEVTRTNLTGNYVPLAYHGGIVNTIWDSLMNEKNINAIQTSINSLNQYVKDMDSIHIIPNNMKYPILFDYENNNLTLDLFVDKKNTTTGTQTFTHLNTTTSLTALPNNWICVYLLYNHTTRDVKVIQNDNTVLLNNINGYVLLAGFYTDSKNYVYLININSEYVKVILKPSLNTTTSGTIVDNKITPYLGERFIGTRDVLTNKWCGKTINFIGDSIMYGVDPNNSYVRMKDDNICSIAREELGFAIARNYGIPGALISAASWIGNLINQYSNMDDADAVVLEGGTNDFYNNAPMGDLADVSDNTKFKPALYNILNALMTKYNTVLVCTPMHRNDSKPDTSTNTQNLTLKDYRDAIIEVCELLSIPVLDLWSEAGFTPHNSAMKTIYMPDGLHPSKYGVRNYIAPRIINKIKTL